MTGSILLIKTYFCPISWLIRKLTKSRFNHACLILDSSKILDYTCNQTKIKSINAYSNKLLYKTQIVSIGNFNYDENYRLVQKAMHMEESFKFEWHKFLISMVQIYFKKFPIKHTCSGLVAKLLKEQYSIRFDKPYYLITPEDLFKRRKL